MRKVSAIANLNASAGSLSFGKEPTGKPSAAKSITLTSVGPLEIGSISVSQDFAYTDHCPALPASGSSCTIDIFLKPTARGTRTGTLMIHTNGFFTPDVSVELTGMAVGRPAAK